MEIDRRSFLTAVGGTAAVGMLSADEQADELEHYMMEQLDQQAAAAARRGTGSLFMPSGRGEARQLKTLEPMPNRPTLVDFFKLRFAPATHVLQSATDALKKGQKEETVLACLLHDVVLNLIKVDHGWWATARRAVRLGEGELGDSLSPVLAVLSGFDCRLRISGDVQPYLREGLRAAAAHQGGVRARAQHKWYMEARLITVHDQYAFNPEMVVSMDPFIDIIGRHFKQPKEGLGADNSAVAHMWRTMVYPDNPL